MYSEVKSNTFSMGDRNADYAIVSVMKFLTRVIFQLFLYLLEKLEKLHSHCISYVKVLFLLLPRRIVHVEIGTIA